MSDVTIDQKFSELSMVPHDAYWVYAVAAAIAAMGFATIFNVQRRLLWVVAVGGIIAVCTRNFVNFELGYGPVIGSFMGSFVVSLIAVKAVHWFHVPNHVLTIPSVIPMVPGVLMYRSLLALINMRGVVGEVTLAFSNGINSALIIFCIALGVAVPNIFARRYIAKDRQRFLTQMLAERRARGKIYRVVAGVCKQYSLKLDRQRKGFSMQENPFFFVYQVYSVNFWVRLLLLPLDDRHILRRSTV